MQHLNWILKRTPWRRTVMGRRDAIALCMSR
jgi:hypothetical protein